MGALNMFRTDTGVLDDDVFAAQALADVATIASLRHQSIIDAQKLNEQLHGALNSRIIIEQAKGKIAEAAGLDMDQAFQRLPPTPAITTSASPETSQTAPSYPDSSTPMVTARRTVGDATNYRFDPGAQSSGRPSPPRQPSRPAPRVSSFTPRPEDCPQPVGPTRPSRRGITPSGREVHRR